MSMIYNATPRQGDLFGNQGRHIETNEETRRATAIHTLFHVSTLQKSLNSDTLTTEISNSLALNQILHENVPAASLDACSTNIASANEQNDVARTAGKFFFS